MALMIAGLLLFFTPHMVSVINHDWRDKTAQRMGELGWKAAYSLVALVGFWFIIKGYGDARLTSEFLYDPPRWLSHVAALLMLPVFPLLIATYLPCRIQRITRHPMLVATKFWALSHLLVNGRVVEIVLFGSFLLWAGLVRFSLKRRPVRTLPQLPQSKLNDVIAVIVGIALYGLFVMFLHRILIGVAPIG